jgi:hypothetical protein
MIFKLKKILDTLDPCDMCARDPDEFDAHNSDQETAKYLVRFFGLNVYGKRKHADAQICDTCLSKFKKLHSGDKLDEDQYITLLAETDMFLGELTTELEEKEL